MVEDDTFTYHVKRQPVDRTDTASSLITKERMQKLDLLIHLLSNLTQALVVCGPNGIGKTTLLTTLQARKTESWRYCFLQGNASLSFEAIQAKLILAHQPTSKNEPQQAKQIVLIVDNAGDLVPGLIAAIIQYAAANPVLRVVFALTHDELQVKRGSDRAVDDCHIVEIPTLSEKQCGDFLRYLSTKPSLNVSFKAVSDNMIAHIYRETHGVPGRIIAEVSGLSSVKSTGKWQWILVVAPVIFALIFGVQWLLSSVLSSTPLTSAPAKIIVPKITEPKLAEQKATPVETVTPKAEPQVVPIPPLNQLTVLQPEQPITPDQKQEALTLPEANLPKDDQQPASVTVKPEAVVVKQLENTPAVVKPLTIPQEKPNKNVAPSVDNKTPETTNMAERLWAKQQQLKQAELSKTLDSLEPPTANNLVATTPEQPAKVEEVSKKPIETTKPKEALVSAKNYFTLQLMVLSKQASANSLLKKYPAMKPDFRVVQTIIKGQEKFVLNYGAYPDAISANNARLSLPFEFRNALVRKINSTDR